MKTPKNLSKPAKKLYREILDEYSIDDPAGLAILKTALEAWDRSREAREAIDRDGPTYMDRFGCPKGHPLLTVERDSRSQFLQALKALNLDIEPLRDAAGRPPGVMKRR